MEKPYEKHRITYFLFDCDKETWKLFVGTDILTVEHEPYEWGGDLVLDAADAWRFVADDADDLALNTRDTTPAAIEAYIAKHGVNDILDDPDSLANNRMGDALDIMRRHAGDEEHHNAWVIDQVARVLLGAEYEVWVAETKDGEHGPNTFSWNTGIAP